MKIRFKHLFVFLVISILVMAPQIAQHAIILGADSSFHFNRFFDAEEQIANRNFQYFISIFGFSQSGRIVNAIYSPYIAYLNGFILYIFKSWFLYQVITGILVTFFSGISMYYLLVKNHVTNIGITMFVPIMYMLTYGVTTWITGQQFLSWGAAIVPLGISVATRLIRDRREPINIIEMSLVVSIAIEVHMLSSVLLVFILFIFLLASLWRVSNVWKLFKYLSISIFITLLLTSNIWIALFEVYSANDIMGPFDNLTPLQNGMVNFLEDGRLYWTLAVIFIIQIGLITVVKIKVDFNNKFVTLCGTILLFLTLPIVPWNYLFAHVPFISVIQFPYRLLPFADCLLLLGFALSLNQLVVVSGKHFISGFNLSMFLCIVVTIMNVQSTIYTSSLVWNNQTNIILNTGNITYKENGSELRKAFSNKNLGMALSNFWKPVPDYLPFDNNKVILHPYNQYSKEIASNTINKKLIDGSKLKISWNPEKNERYHNTGVVKYKRTEIKVGGKIAPDNQYYTTSIGTVMFKNKSGRNSITISYKPLLVTKLILILNLISWISYILLLFILKLKFIYNKFTVNKNRILI